MRCARRLGFGAAHQDGPAASMSSKQPFATACSLTLCRCRAPYRPRPVVLAHHLCFLTMLALEDPPPNQSSPPQACSANASFRVGANGSSSARAWTPIPTAISARRLALPISLLARRRTARLKIKVVRVFDVLLCSHRENVAGLERGCRRR